MDQVEAVGEARAAGEQRQQSGDEGQSLQAAPPDRQLGEVGVAAEQFVAANPGDHHFQTQRGGVLADQPGVKAVDAGLVHVLQRLGQVGGGLGVADPDGVLLGAVAGGDGFGVDHFILAGPAKAAEAEGDGLQGGAAVFGHQPDQRAGVDAGGQERADRDVGDLMSGHRVRHGRADPFEQGGFGQRFGRLRRRAPDIGDRCVRSRGGRAGGGDPERVAGRQGADAAIDGVGFGYAAQQQEADQGGGVGAGVGGEVVAQGLDLGGEGEAAGVVAVVEGFDAVGVARQPQGAPGRVPEGEGVHAAQALEQVFAPVAVAVEQDFGVAVGMEDTAGVL